MLVERKLSQKTKHVNVCVFFVLFYRLPTRNRMVWSEEFFCYLDPKHHHRIQDLNR